MQAKLKPPNFYLSIAELYAAESKAERAKVGAVLVTNSGILIPGYNGTPAGEDNACELDLEGKLVTKANVIHAEMNCLIKCSKEGVSSSGAILYVTLSPCSACAAAIVAAGISAVYYKELYETDNKGITALSYLAKHLKVEKIEVKGKPMLKTPDFWWNFSHNKDEGSAVVVRSDFYEGDLALFYLSPETDAEVQIQAAQNLIEDFKAGRKTPQNKRIKNAR